MRLFISGAILSLFGALLLGCGKKQANQPDTTTFTRADSLTEHYLSLQDSMLRAWNIMIHDDNQKIKDMHNLLHELMVSNPSQRETVASFEERLHQLPRMRYTQKSLANTDVVEEYDFASNSIITELITLAESQTEFAYNTTIQKLVDEIRAADQRVNNYRTDYDSVVILYNRFISKNRSELKDIVQSNTLETKPMFQMVSED